MPERKKKTIEKKIPTSRTTSPFKDEKLLKEEITKFINIFKTTVVNQVDKISQYFEMSCFNYIVKFYEINNYSPSIENLIDGKYKYKCITSGIQSNFSHFKVTKVVNSELFEFEIHHNLAVQSSHSKEIFTTPDISIIKKDKINETIEYYDIKRRFCYVTNEDLISFCEVKHFNPFPELILSFIGVVNELRKDIMTNTAKTEMPYHIAPSLMVSGKPNKQAQKIKEQLEMRYCINIIFDIFNSGTETFSKKKVLELRTTGTL